MEKMFGDFSTSDIEAVKVSETNVCENGWCARILPGPSRF